MEYRFRAGTNSKADSKTNSEWVSPPVKPILSELHLRRRNTDSADSVFLIDSEAICISESVPESMSELAPRSALTSPNVQSWWQLNLGEKSETYNSNCSLSFWRLNHSENFEHNITIFLSYFLLGNVVEKALKISKPGLEFCSIITTTISLSLLSDSELKILLKKLLSTSPRCPACNTSLLLVQMCQRNTWPVFRVFHSHYDLEIIWKHLGFLTHFCHENIYI